MIMNKLILWNLGTEADRHAYAYAKCERLRLRMVQWLRNRGGQMLLDRFGMLVTFSLFSGAPKETLSNMP